MARRLPRGNAGARLGRRPGAAAPPAGRGSLGRECHESRMALTVRPSGHRRAANRPTAPPALRSEQHAPVVGARLEEILRPRRLLEREDGLDRRRVDQTVAEQAEDLPQLAA